MALHFEKWEGTGNDFVLVDGRTPGRLPSDWADEEVAAICDRRRGVGADGVVVVSVDDAQELHVDFRNPDGSRSFCGNGTRSAVAWAFGAGLVGRDSVVHAVDGTHHGRVGEDGVPGVTMNVAGWPKELPAQVPGADGAAFLDTGSPHHVEWLPSREALDRLDLAVAGPSVRNHPRYAPSGCNVNAVAVTESGLAIRTFERGVEAETLSCGTGVVAASLADIARCATAPGTHTRSVTARGGDLVVHAQLDDSNRFSNVWLFGAARRVFAGTWLWALAVVAGWGNDAFATDLAGRLTDDARASVLTASPGEDLYAAFGHTAIRIFDPASRSDWVFNYGTFVVDDGFYVRFVRGRMDYRLGVEPYGRFQNTYLRQGRALHEQVLNLAPEDVRALAEYLEWNAQPENATYAYDFFRDNCATKVIAVLQEVFGARFAAGCVPTDSTYLEALRPYTSGQPWSAWGMELILGAEASTTMKLCGHAFLPDVLAHQLESMTLDGEPLAFPREIVFPHEGSWHAGIPAGHSGRNAPARATWFWAVLLAILWRFEQGGSRLASAAAKVARGLTSFAGLVLSLLFVSMMLFTDHNDTWWNADVLWTAGGALVLVPASRPWKRRVVQLWTVLAVVSVLVVPIWRSHLHGVEALVWPTLGACAATVISVWTSLRQAP